jgi:GAF domain-containing protein
MLTPRREDIWIKHFNKVERKTSRASGEGCGAGSEAPQNGARFRNGRDVGELAELAADRSSDTVERILKAAREHLGMDVAFASEFTRGEQVYRRIEGDGESFGLCEGEGIALEGTYCWRVVGGSLSNVVQDASNDVRVRDLDVTGDANIGSYVAVPLQFSDGRLYGTLCCLSHVPDPSLRDQDAEFMKVLARLMIEQLEREELESKNWRLRLRATGADALLAALEARDGYTGEQGAHSLLRRGTRPSRAHHTGRARTLGRRGLPGRSAGRGDTANQPHRLRLRRLAHHDLRPSLPRGAGSPDGDSGAEGKLRHAVLSCNRRGAARRHSRVASDRMRTKGQLGSPSTFQARGPYRLQYDRRSEHQGVFWMVVPEEVHGLTDAELATLEDKTGARNTREVDTHAR